MSVAAYVLTGYFTRVHFQFFSAHLKFRMYQIKLIVLMVGNLLVILHSVVQGQKVQFTGL